MMQSDRLRLLGAAALFSTGGAAIKATPFSAWQVAGFRAGVAAVALLLLVPEARRTWHRSWRGALVAVGYALTVTLYVAANKLTTSANSIFLQSTAPLYVMLVGPWLLRERMRTVDLPVMLAVAAGMLCFFVGTDAPARTAPDPATGNILAAISGITWASTLMGLRWMGRAQADGREAGSAVGAVALGNVLACVAALPFAFPVVNATAASWLIIVYLGVIQIALAYVWLSQGLRTVPALEASLLLLLEPALNPVWSWLVHAERPGRWALVGGAIILLATTIKTGLDARPRLAPT
jgi:drug/metabolite transporter (DMT)-like permease